MDPTTLTLATDVFRADPTFTLLEEFADAVASASGGALAIDLFAPGELIGAFEVADAVASGVVDLGWSLAGAGAFVFPGLRGFDLPLSVRLGEADSAAAFEVVLAGGFDPAAVDILATAYFGDTFLGINSPIADPADFEGLILTARGPIGEILQASFGVNIANIPFGEINAAIQTGVIDGVVASTPTLSAPLRLADVIEDIYVDADGRLLAPTLRVLTINEATRASLPTALADVLDDETGIALSRAWGNQIAEATGLETLPSGNSTRALPQSVVDALETATETYVADAFDPTDLAVAEAFTAARRGPGSGDDRPADEAPSDPTPSVTTEPQTIRGGTASESLVGGAGDDTIIGFGGNDVVTGGAGADIFAFFRPTEGPLSMEIEDFSGRDGEGDRIAVDDSLIGLGAPALDIRDFTFADFQRVLELRTVAFNAAEGRLRVDRDGPDGPAGFEVLAQFDAGTQLTIADVILF